MLEQFFSGVLMEIEEGHASSRLLESPVPAGATLAASKEDMMSIFCNPQLVCFLTLGYFELVHGSHVTMSNGGVCVCVCASLMPSPDHFENGSGKQDG